MEEFHLWIEEDAYITFMNTLVNMMISIEIMMI